MKVFFVTSTLISGGSERVMSLLANSLSKRGWDISIINLNQHIVFYPINDNVKIVFAEDEASSKSILKKIIWLRQYVKQSKPDVVVPFMEAVYCVTLLALFGVSIPIISSERIDPRKSPFVRNILRRIFLPLTTHLVVQTEDIKRFYPWFIRKKTSIIYNPVSEKVFALHKVEKYDRIVSVGKLDYQKNHQMLINAFSYVAQKFPNYQLYIYGEGPLRSKLEGQIDNLGLKDRVFLPGRTEQVLEEMNKSKVFCFSSNFEGMSNAMLEAICLGLPIVITNVSGVSDLIEDGVNGYVVNCSDTDNFAQALSNLLENEDKMNSFSIKNKNKAPMFRLDKIVDEWEQLIIKVVSKFDNNAKEK